MNLLSITTLFLSVLIHFHPLNNNWIANAMEGKIPLILSLFLATSYLLYPLCGVIAEVYLTNVKVMKWSFIVILISSVSAFGICLLMISSPTSIKDLHLYIAACMIVMIITGLIGSAMFEAIAIQFGMDQMLEASSNQLSSYIHWYFWSVNISPLITYCAFFSVSLAFFDCKIKIKHMNHDGNHFFGWQIAVASSFQLALSVCGIVVTFCAAKWLTIEKSSRNSLKIIVRVLCYSYKHRHPENRSAFTYWENYIPSRIDLGKEKYGGPFTHEQVEDVKTMFRLLLLILSLFGYHLSGDGYSLTYYIINAMGCPTSIPLALMMINPQQLTLVIVVLAIPLFQLFQKRLSRYIPSLLHRLWLGLLFCLVSECIQCSFSLLIKEKEFNCSELYRFSEKPSLLMQCFAAQFKVVKNDTCEYMCSTSLFDDNFIYISAIPLIINGFSYLLVFVTTVEFICAQSPNAMKGLLIGVWYSMLFIKFALVNNLDIYPFLLEVDNWNIYHGTKGLCMFVSIILFSLIYKHYKYRERNEIVNEQTMIEEQYERELLLNSSNVFEHS